MSTRWLASLTGIIGPVMLLSLISTAPLHADLVLSGQVVDQDGLPVDGALVEFAAQGYPSLRNGGQTNAQGGYLVRLTGARPATAVQGVSWATVKAGPTAQIGKTVADTVTVKFLSVAITHEEIRPFRTDSVRVPTDGVLDFVVERVGNPTTAAPGSGGTPGTEPGDGGNPTDLGTDDPDPGSGDGVGLDDVEMFELLAIPLDGQYVSGLSIRAERSSWAVGDTIRIRFVGLGLSQVKQFELLVDLPAQSIDLQGAVFRAQAPFAGPGVELQQAPTIRVAGAILSMTETAEGEAVLGDLLLPTLADLSASTPILLQKVSLGPRSSVRDTYEDLGVAIPVVVR